MKKHFFLTLAILLTALFASAQGYETTIPDEDHMSYFDLRGPVKEVRLYNYGGHSKTLWKFDKQGRLTHYEAYATPFAGNGGCVFGMTDRYRYAYDEEGKMIILETFNEVENLVDENDGKVLTLFPMREPKDVLFEQASKEYGDTTYCYSRWYEKEGDPLEHYHGRRYDKYGNWIEDFVGTEDSYSYTDTRVREIKYYKDIELMNLPMGVRSVINQWEADDKKWSNRYDFDKEGYLTHFRSWVKVDAYTPLEQLFEWDVKTDNTPGSDLIAVESGESSEVKREVYFWSSVPVGELKFLPEGVNEKEAFGLIFDYMGYVFEGDLYPLHNGWWIVLNYWCLDEMDGIYLGEDENGEPIPAASQYKDPFAGMKYPIIKTDSVGFSTRNYSNQIIKMYKESDGKKVYDKLRVQCNVDVLDADPKTRRLLCRTNPGDWCWDDKPYQSVYGWMDEEWVCANLLTTCP